MRETATCFHPVPQPRKSQEEGKLGLSLTYFSCAGGGQSWALGG